MGVIKEQEQIMALRLGKICQYCDEDGFCFMDEKCKYQSDDELLCLKFFEQFNIEQAIYREGYDAGIEDGSKSVENWNECYLKAKEYDAYNRGLNDAWEAARKIHDGNIPYKVFGLSKNGNGFTYANPLNWNENMPISEVIAKIKEYEDEKKLEKQMVEPQEKGVCEKCLYAEETDGSHCYECVKGESKFEPQESEDKE